MIKFGNITMTSDSATVQDAFDLWIRSKASELVGPDGQTPGDETIKAYIMDSFRELRKELLLEDDWMFLEDSPVSAKEKQRVATYRQALRNIPQNFPDIRDAVFPSKK